MNREEIEKIEKDQDEVCYREANDETEIKLKGKKVYLRVVNRGHSIIIIHEGKIKE